MPASSTLALGQASYELLDVLDAEDTATAATRKAGVAQSVYATSRGGLIEGLQLEFDPNTGPSGFGAEISALNVLDRTSGLAFTDGASSDARINLYADSEFASLDLGDGTNRLSSSRDLSDSTVTALGGNDQVRIGGAADRSTVDLGDGDNRFTNNSASSDLGLATGSGDDTALFLGTLTSTAQSASEAPNVVLGGGDDRATFLGGVQGGEPGAGGYAIELGAGADRTVFGSQAYSDGFVLNTGSGSDTVILGRSTDNATIDLGIDSTPGSGDSVVLGLGTELSNSGIESQQDADTLRLAGTVRDTSLDLGAGSAFVDVTGSVALNSAGSSVWDLGAGDDTLIFGSTSDLSSSDGSVGFISLGEGADDLSLFGTGSGPMEFDLGNDTDSDIIRFSQVIGYEGFTIANFGSNDILFIGNGQYGYGYAFLNEFANEWDLNTFKDAGNVIWSQTTDGGDAAQELMTLDTSKLDPSTEVDTSVITDLSTDSSWTGVGADTAPLSIEPPSPVMPDDQIPT